MPPKSIKFLFLLRFIGDELNHFFLRQYRLCTWFDKTSPASIKAWVALRTVGLPLAVTVLECPQPPHKLWAFRRRVSIRVVGALAASFAYDFFKLKEWIYRPR